MKAYRDLAKRISNELFTSCDGPEARRLALVVGEERFSSEMAGWNKLAATNRIEMVIENFYVRTPHQKGKSK